jgi:hypothetical protein
MYYSFLTYQLLEYKNHSFMLFNVVKNLELLSQALSKYHGIKYTTFTTIVLSLFQFSFIIYLSA